AAAEQTARLWDTTSGNLIAAVTHPQPVQSIEFSPDGSYLVSTDGEKNVYLWNARDGSFVRTLEGSVPLGRALFSPDARKVGACFGAGGYLPGEHGGHVWDVATGKLLLTLKGHTFPIRRVLFDQSSEFVATVARDNSIKLWSLSSGRELHSLEGHREAILNI